MPLNIGFAAGRNWGRQEAVVAGWVQGAPLWASLGEKERMVWVLGYFIVVVGFGLNSFIIIFLN